LQKEIIKTIDHVCNTIIGNGPYGRIQRFMHVVPLAVECLSGNIIEIGAGVGESTKIFLKVSQHFNRKTLCIDPFCDIKYGGNDYIYRLEEFTENTYLYKEYLTLCKDYSHTKNALEHINNFGEIAFAFVDGDQSFTGVLTDLYNMSNARAKVICIDDMGSTDKRGDLVRKAVIAFMEIYSTEYTLIRSNKDNIEGYLVCDC